MLESKELKLQKELISKMEKNMIIEQKAVSIVEWKVPLLGLQTVNTN